MAIARSSWVGWMGLEGGDTQREPGWLRHTRPTKGGVLRAWDDLKLFSLSILLVINAQRKIWAHHGVRYRF